ncbi:MAG: FHA domain-containing protein [Clostridiales bacterium]|nr:FHA domain-containing protein [Clostridiales bacterium]
MEKKRRTLILLLVLVPSIFILFLIGVLTGGIVVPLIILIALAVALGVLSRKKPELFEDMRPREDLGTKSTRSVPSEPLHYDEVRKTYLELACVNVSGGKNIVVDKTPFVIGRNTVCDFVTANPEVSSRHVRIEYNEEKRLCFATDLRSTNHTFINNDRLEPDAPHPLKQGDILHIANEAYQVEYAHF